MKEKAIQFYFFCIHVLFLISRLPSDDLLALPPLSHRWLGQEGDNDKEGGGKEVIGERVGGDNVGA
jgi:hypothetical protein